MVSFREVEIKSGDAEWGRGISFSEPFKIKAHASGNSSFAKVCTEKGSE